MHTAALVTLIISIYNSNTGVESVRTEHMTRAACETELLRSAATKQPGEFFIGQCVSDSKFFGGK